MASLIHKLHYLLIILARYSLVFTVIFFLPVPLSHFLTGSVLQQTQHSPLFEYFTHYNISTDDVLESTYTNVYIGENKDEVKQWDVDNALLWADALAYRLEEQNIPVMKKIIGQKEHKKKTNKSSKNKKTNVQLNHNENQFLLPQEIRQTLIDVSQQLHSLIPFISLTQEARQWIIIALDSTPKSIKKQLKQLINHYPEDNFLIITKTPMNLGKKSLKMDLPSFNLQQAKNILVQGLKVTQKQAQMLLKVNKNSLLQLIKENGQNQQFTIKSLLGQNYHQFDGINEKQQEILNKLCHEGKVKVGKIKMDLTQYDVIVKNKHYQWLNEQSELNYELQKEKYCSKQLTIQEESKVKETKQQQQTKSHSQSIQQNLNNITSIESQAKNESQQSENLLNTKSKTEQNKLSDQKDKEQL